jgi:hypothetical protein
MALLSTSIFSMAGDESAALSYPILETGAFADMLIPIDFEKDHPLEWSFSFFLFILYHKF